MFVTRAHRKKYKLKTNGFFGTVNWGDLGHRPVTPRADLGHKFGPHISVNNANMGFKQRSTQSTFQDH